MDEHRARRIVDALRERGVPAHFASASAGRSKPGVRINLPDGREALWDTDGTAGLEAMVLHDGVLVGFVPAIARSEDFTDAEIVEAIASVDYDRPVAHRRDRPTPPAPSLPREGGLLRRFTGGFREP